MAGGQFAPVVDHFVLMIALADNRQTVAGFVIRNDVRRGGEKRGGGAGALDELAAVQLGFIHGIGLLRWLLKFYQAINWSITFAGTTPVSRWSKP